MHRLDLMELATDPEKRELERAEQFRSQAQYNLCGFCIVESVALLIAAGTGITEDPRYVYPAICIAALGLFQFAYNWVRADKIDPTAEINWRKLTVESKKVETIRNALVAMRQGQVDSDEESTIEMITHHT